MRSIVAVVCMAPAFVLAGCLSWSPSRPLVIAPTHDDWERAATRIGADGLRKLREAGPLLALGKAADGKIYDLGTTTVCSFEKVDLTRVVSEFNAVFAREGSFPWTIDAISVEMQITAPSGYQTELFEVRWTISHHSGGSIQAQSAAQGSGVNIKWGNDEGALARDANIAFAEAILRLVVNTNNLMKEPNQAPLPTSASVTPRAGARVAPAALVAGL